MLNRRYFLTAGAGSLLSLGLFPLATLAKITSGNSPAPSAIQGINQKSAAQCGVYDNGKLIASLTLVGLSTPPRPDPKLDQYLLNFEAATPVKLAEATYELDHPAWGRLQLFLQPCGTLNSDNHDGKQYRACISVFR